MISTSCTKFLQDSDLDSFITELKYYLDDKTFSKQYSGDIKTRCQWILLNYSDYNDFLNRDPSKDIYSLRDQIRCILAALAVSASEPTITDDELADVDTGWSF